MNYSKLFLRSVLVAGLALSGTSFAHKKESHKNGSAESPRAKKYALKLSGCCGLDAAQASGRLDYRRSAEKSGRANEKFDAKVKIPFPNATLNFTTPEAAAAAQFRLSFARGGVNFATCALVFNPDSLVNDDDSDDNSTLSAQYRLRLESRGTSRFRAKRGSCDTDLTTEGIQAGIPQLQTGDVVSVEQVVGDVSTPFLQATK